MSGQRSTSAAGHVSLEVGQPFNPFRLFNGIFIPDALVRAKGISLGAKITYGRLTRYAGQHADHDALVKALRSSLRFRSVAPDRISVPLLAAVYRVPFGRVGFQYFLTGRTGTFKNALAALRQQHFGADC